MRWKAGLLALAVAAFAAASTAASAAEFVFNGGFELTKFAKSEEFGANDPGGQVVNGWDTSGYNFVFRPGEADSVGAMGSFGNLKLWGPANGTFNGLTESPAGGNYVAADPQFITDSIRQTINGLAVGSTYNLTFYWAGAQQFAFDGPTTEGWHVTFGGETFDTPIVAIENHGFSGWRQATASFKATSASQVLSFLAVGGPSGAEPPFVLLDGVSLTAGVPEPATWGLMLLGFVSLGALARRSRARTARG